MNNEPLWSKDDTGYWLLFPNKRALTKDQIKEIFGKYGEIVLYTEAGDEKGFRFIKYATLEETEAAIEDLRRNPLISLIPHRPKAKNKQSSPDQDGKNNFFPRKFNSENNESFSKVERQFDDLNHNESKLLCNSTNDECSANYRSINHEINDSRKINDQLYRKFNFPDDLRNYNYKRSSQSDNVSVSSSISTYENYTTQNNGSTSLMNSRCNSPFNRILKLRGLKDSFPISSTSVSKFESEKYDSADKIPDLVKKISVGFDKEPKEQIYKAHEIIVANVHSNYGSAFILHLLEQYEPLAISKMKEIPKMGTQFCHVYFKSLEDSIKVEEQFDKIDLCNKKLIVLRPLRLKEEAIA